MSAAHPDPDLLLALDEGVLPAELATEVAGHLASCRICAQLQADLRACAEPSLAETERVRRRTFAAPQRWRWAAGGLLAASLIAGAILSRQPNTGQPPAPAPAVTQQAPLPAPVYRLTAEPAPLRLPLAAALVLRGQEAKAPDAYLKELGQALEPYRAARYPEAAAALRALGQRHQRAVEPAFYEGVARLLAGETTQADQALTRAEAIGGEALHEDILWYRAIALERTSQWPLAQPLLQRLCQGEGPYRERACRALTPAP